MADLVVLVTIDTWRYDAFSYTHPEGKVKTPHLDKLATEGVVFTDAYAHNVVTLPSHANILTGMYPYQHGIRDNAGFRLGSDVKSLSHLMKEAGYRTAAFVSAFPLDARYGLNAGFDHYDDGYDAFSEDGLVVPQRPGPETIKNAETWIQAQGDAKQFVWVHIYEPHFPYMPPEPFATEYKDQPYYGEVAWSDKLMGDFFDGLKATGKDITAVITSDHGEGLGEHGELTHGVFTYNATLKAPLIFWSPKRLQSGVVAERARHIDIAPSLLRLNGMDVYPGMTGKPLFGADFTVEPSYFESLSTFFNRGWAPLRGCVDDHYKAIDLPIVELYDLEQDPNELSNLAEADVERARLFMTCLPVEAGLGSSRGSLTAEEIANLQALGYVSGANETEEEPSLQDPKLLIETDKKFEAALTHLQTGRIPEAIAGLEALTREQPQMAVAFYHLSDAHEARGRTDLAIEVMTRALRNGIRTEYAIRKLALYLTGTGEAGEAWQLMQPFLDSNDPETYATFGKIHTAFGRFNEAQVAFNKALELDAGNPQTLADMGTLNLYANKPQEALGWFQRSLETNPTNGQAWNGLGVAMGQLNRVNEAINAWENAIKHDPKILHCYYNLGLYYQRIGNRDLAAARLRTYIELAPAGPNRQKAVEKLKDLQ